MKKLLFLLATVTLLSCSKSFDDIKQGMTKKEVISIVGEPNEKQELFAMEYWIYEDHLLVMKNDTLSEFKNKEELEKIGKEIDKDLDKIQKTLDEN
jgi:outer membrane protein assembly factor BamE (lipoprotein component of BamABCDE complex)